ncbi:pantetheine-phosphate adenylyltransferase [Lactobacillus kalixensis]|uniref:Phosphopantetheine adenylyltransferase n=1 Tax=Lactobacillus kalixensis DSM 16043 TaxID=1423763 RepID=A0A0R1UD32_9LACO|nr:pantetheine-phosphate adenylyltransferase [Lactobacillus kalixensis]KRL91321.1 phosphopantetheine adenylyltransferase [Lactobacillus kalixensis DSM 16043]
MSVSFFPGSFDPITNGHLDVIRQAANIFDQVYVVIMTNTNKNYLFSPDQREEFVRDAIQGIDNVQVIKRPEELAVNVAQELNVDTIVRGVRNTQDFLYEQQIAGINKKIYPKLNTVLLFTSPKNSFVASSMVKEVARFDGDISEFLPKKAAKALKEKMRSSNG